MGRQDLTKPRTPGTFSWGVKELALPSIAKFKVMCAAHEWWYEKTDCGYEEYDRWRTNEAYLEAIAEGGGEKYEKVYKAKGKDDGHLDK